MLFLCLSTHSLIENLRTKGIIFNEALRIRVKKFKQTLLENHSKITKIAIAACKFAKIFWGSMPPTPLELFLFLNQLQICSAKKNLRLKKRWELWLPSLSKFLAMSLVHYDCITACLFSIEKCAKMSVLLCENHKNSLVPGGCALRSPWPSAAGGFTPKTPIMDPLLPNLGCDTDITYHFCVLLLC